MLSAARVLGACALSGALAACAQQSPPSTTATAAGPATAAAAPSAGATVAPAVRAVAERLAAQDRIADAKLLASVRRYAGATARDVTPRGSHVERLLVTVTNRGSRDLHGVSGRLQVFRARDARRLGLATFHAEVEVEPGRSARVPVAIPMGSFAEGAGPLAQDAGRPKLVQLELTGVDFERGRGASETD
jgi:hypothetical protein